MLANLIGLLLPLLMSSTLIYDFNSNSDIRDWRIIDDVVMGGRSNGSLKLNKEGHAIFSGDVSLDNNGGFSSVRFRPSGLSVAKSDKISIRLKGDGKQYQFRVKDDLGRYYSYITNFETTGDWEDIEITLNDMYPSFRGYKLNVPNFNHTSIEEVVFLIGNKRNEEFQLLIDKIEITK